MRAIKDDPKWAENMGQWKDPEKAREAGKKGAETMKRKAAARKAIRDGSLLEDAAINFTENNPEWLDELIEMYQSIVKDPNSDSKVRMQAAAQLTEMLGTKAPKRQAVEIKQEQEMTPEQAAEIIQKANLKVVGED